MTYQEWTETEDGGNCLRWAKEGGERGAVALHFAFQFGQVDGGRAVDRLLDIYADKAIKESEA
jgi:hypothetical protein